MWQILVMIIYYFYKMFYISAALFKIILNTNIRHTKYSNGIERTLMVGYS